MMRRAVFAIVLAAVACHSTVYDAVDPVVRVETPRVWAGGDIVLTSADFIGQDTLPLVLLGDDTLLARYAPPDSLHVIAPSRQGTSELWVGFRGRLPLPFGAVSVEGGYTGTFVVQQAGGYPLAWPGGAHPTFLIAGRGGLVMVDPSHRTTVLLQPESVFSPYCSDGPGPATNGQVAVAGRTAGGGCGPLVALRPDLPALPTDTGPSCSGCRFAAQLGPGRWLKFYHQGFQSWARDSTGAWTSTEFMYYDESYDVVISPRGDRALPIGARSDGRGTPVFTPASAAPAYVLDQFSVVWGARFTEGSDTLYIVASATDTAGNTQDVLAVLRASDGTVLQSTPVWDGAIHLVLDPGRPWLYLVGREPYPAPPVPVVHVIDRATLAPVVTLTGAPPSMDLGDLYPVLSPLERKLYLVDTCPFCSGSSWTEVTVFDLLR